MKAIILAGGKGTRFSEETGLKPKPMIEIGGRPILWHIMKIYEQAQITDFIVLLGYKGYVIKEFFSNYFMHTQDVTFDLANNTATFHAGKTEPWRVTLVDTGEETQTGGRLKRVKKYLDEKEPFCFTYGDGVSDINIKKLVEFHKQHQKWATVTAVQPPGRFGALKFKGTQVSAFEEKPSGDGAWISGGFFVLNPSVIDLIDHDETMWEREPMERLAKKEELHAYFHNGFWKPMDTKRDHDQLEEMWNKGKAPWKSW